METGLRILLLTALLATLAGCASWRHKKSPPPPSTQSVPTAQSPDEAPPRVVEPEVTRREIKVPKIRSSNVELGLFYGELSIEDFGAHPVSGITVAYHITEDFFFQAEAGRAKAGRTSFEVLNGGVQLLTDSERQFTYYDLSLGYNFLPGEAFLGRGVAMTSAFYLIGGFGGTDFAGDTKFTLNFGAGYRVVPIDWMAVHVTVQDHVFQTSLLGTTKLTNNLEARLGVTVFF